MPPCPGSSTSGLEIPGQGEPTDDGIVSDLSFEGIFWKRAQICPGSLKSQKSLKHQAQKVNLLQVGKQRQRKGSVITEATQIVSGGTKARMQDSDSQTSTLSTYCSVLEKWNKSWGREGIKSSLDRQTNLQGPRMSGGRLGGKRVCDVGSWTS